MRNTGRYDAFFEPQRMDCWTIVDFNNVEPGSLVPEENTVRLTTEQTVTLLRAVAKTDLINQILAERTYDRDMANRHLDIVDRLISKL